MCTVTYLPNRSGFILTHNRDEAPTRSPKTLTREQIGQDTVLFPRDTKAGGSWIVTTRSGKTACLLNGAFLKHKHEPPYRRSRGLVLLDFLAWTEPDAFFERYDFTDIEPFTFLFFEASRVAELRWDGVQRHVKQLDASQPHFWCSATLYPPDMQQRRELLFRQWLLRRPAPTPRAILQLHLHGSIGDPENDYVMNRNGRVQTVSVSQVVRAEQTAALQYRDLLEGLRDRKKLTVR